MYKLKASCHCGNIQIDVGLTQELKAYPRRACDCDFCMKQGASYISDPQGTLEITVKDSSMLGKYKQGSGTADFLFCKNCGIFTVVIYQNEGRTFAALNSTSFENPIELAEKVVVSPKKLETTQKTSRWQEVWFQNVNLVFTK